MGARLSRSPVVTCRRPVPRCDPSCATARVKCRSPLDPLWDNLTVDGPLPLALIYASLAFAAVVLVYVALDRTPDWGLLGFAGVIEAGTLVLLVIAASRSATSTSAAARPSRSSATCSPGSSCCPIGFVWSLAERSRGATAVLAVVAARPGLRRRPRAAGVAVTSPSPRPRPAPVASLVAVYGVFALAATARSLVQLFTKADEAPLAYALSALAAVVYIAATLGLAEVGPSPRRLAWAAVVFELVGVLTVGTLTVLDPELFPDATGLVGVRRGLRLAAAGAAVRRARVALAHAPTRLSRSLPPRRMRSDDRGHGRT